MPLVRFQVRNEYGLGQPELYRGGGGVNREDPKQVLDGVAVAGLVGILRQLGDLAEFAAEVFHGLQEQVMATASRSHKLMVRVQNIEAALPPLERAILAQNSHIHFAYTAGSEWHPRIKNEQNQFIYNDLPRFIMDSYEECRDPPRLHLLDKFDTGGPGSCLKRYSDPTFFRRVSGSVVEADAEKVRKDKKAHKTKKKRTSQRNGQIFRSAPLSNQSARFQFTSPVVNGHASPSQIVSTVDMTLKSDLGDHSHSFDSRTGPGYIECVFDINSSLQPEEQHSKESSSRLMQHNRTLDSVFPDEQTRMEDTFSHSSSQDQSARNSSCVTWEQSKVEKDNFSQSLSHEETARNSCCVAWDEKAEIVEPKDHDYVPADDPEMLSTNFELSAQALAPVNPGVVEQKNISFGDTASPTSISGRIQLEEIESEPENYVDALNTIESESETDIDSQTKREVEQYSTILKADRTEDDILQCMTHSSDNHPTSVQSETISCVSSDNGMSSNLADSVPFGSFIHEPVLQVSFTKTDKTEDGIQQFVKHSSDNHPSMVESQAVSGLSSVKGIPSNLHDPDPLRSLAYEQTPLITSTKTDRTDDGIQQPVANSLVDHAPNAESLTASIISSDNRMSCNLSHSPSSESLAHELAPQTSGKSFDLDHLLDSNCCASNDVADGFRVESVTSEPSFSGSRISNRQDPPGDRTISSMFESQDPHADSSRVPSIKIWTNGGLLGLEPSKPSDFSMSNSRSQDFVMSGGDKAIGSPNRTLIVKGDMQKGKQGALVENVQRTEKVFPASTDATTVVIPPTELPLNSYVEATSTEAPQENDVSSSGVFGLGHRLLRKVSLVHDGRSQPANTHSGKSESANSLKAGVLEQRSGNQSTAYQTISEAVFKEMFGCGSPLDSLTSSPPLEHMKISFNPIDGLETSKLKLKFPDGSHCHESVRDMFPSFQLVPESAILLHDIRSESDDDTFCRSSPYMSDDCACHQSESDSEQWESGETTVGNDHDLCDTLCRMSSESFSNSAQLGSTANNGIHVNEELKSIYTGNGDEPPLCGHLLDLPSFDAVNAILQGDTGNLSNLRNLSSSQNFGESTPIPPPLPSVQRWVLKSQLNEVEDKQNAESEDPKSAICQRLLGTSIPEQPNPCLAKQHSNEQIVKPKTKQSDQLKLYGLKESNQAESGKGMDEKEDFLQQIRTKSFNLRPTVTERPPATPTPATNVKVSAILEKANAIRQAVASDDGEDDDNWSDTS